MNEFFCEKIFYVIVFIGFLGFVPFRIILIFFLFSLMVIIPFFASLVIDFIINKTNIPIPTII